MSRVPLTSSEAARAYGCSRRRMQALLTQGRVVGARRHGKNWMIPQPLRIVPGTRGPTRNRI